MNQNLSSKAMEKLDEVNKSAVEAGKVDVNQLLLLTLSTTIMLAKKKPVAKEYYQWTRVYLQNIRDDEGKKLPNMTGLLNEVNEFEKANNIADELQDEIIVDDFGEQEIPDIEIQEISDEDDADEVEFIANTSIPTSTQNPVEFPSPASNKHVTVVTPETAKQSDANLPSIPQISQPGGLTVPSNTQNSKDSRPPINVDANDTQDQAMSSANKTATTDDESDGGAVTDGSTDSKKKKSRSKKAKDALKKQQKKK
jgi:hypothetical protein